MVQVRFLAVLVAGVRDRKVIAACSGVGGVDGNFLREPTLFLAVSLVLAMIRPCRKINCVSWDDGIFMHLTMRTEHF